MSGQTHLLAVSDIKITCTFWNTKITAERLSFLWLMIFYYVVYLETSVL